MGTETRWEIGVTQARDPNNTHLSVALNRLAANSEKGNLCLPFATESLKYFFCTFYPSIFLRGLQNIYSTFNCDKHLSST